MKYFTYAEFSELTELAERLKRSDVMIAGDAAHDIYRVMDYMPRLIELARIGQEADLQAVKNFGEKRGVFDSDSEV